MLQRMAAVAALSLTACPPVASSGDRDVAVDVGPDTGTTDVLQSDVDRIDAGDCGADSMAIRFRAGPDPAVTRCVPMPDGIVVTYQYDPSDSSCSVRRMDARAITGDASITIGSFGSPFAIAGDHPLEVDIASPAVDGFCGSVDAGPCTYSEPSPHCHFVVTTAGAPGQVVEASLAAPCVLSDVNRQDSPYQLLRIESLSIHGIVRSGTTVQFDGAAHVCP